MVVRADGRLGPTATCVAIDGSNRVGPEGAVQLGLVVPGLRKSDFEAGDVIVSVVEGVEDSPR